jgi:hypothetical protein
MTSTTPRRIPALLTALTAVGFLVAAAHPSQAAVSAPTVPPLQVKVFAPAAPISPGASPVICKLGRALLEECDAQLNLRTETYRDEIETASATSAQIGAAKG